MADGHAEPSMEDILSSIKRIIAEDSETALSSPRVKRAVGLTPTHRGAAEAADSAGLATDDVLELTDPVAVEPVPVPVPVTVPAPRADMPKRVPSATSETTPPDAKSEPMAAKPEPLLVSETTAEASRSSLAALSALIVKPEVAGSDTLEGLVRHMLQPMLAEWLDANLADIVERQVAQEIARISARG